MGGKQLGFGDYDQTIAMKRTRREKFLAEMDAVVPWQALIALIEPHYPKTSSKGGRRDLSAKLSSRGAVPRRHSSGYSDLWWQSDERRPLIAAVADPALEEGAIGQPRGPQFIHFSLPKFVAVDD